MCATALVLIQLSAIGANTERDYSDHPTPQTRRGRRRVAELANCLFSRLMTLIFCHVGLVVCSVTAINRWSVRLAVICQSGAVLPDEALRGARGRFQARACVNESHRAVRVWRRIDDCCRLRCTISTSPTLCYAPQHEQLLCTLSKFDVVSM